MNIEIPYYGLRAYALFFSKHATAETFGPSDLDWIVSESMKKKIFSVLAKSGWIIKTARGSYRCRAPQDIILDLLEFRVPSLLKEAQRPYAFTASSAVEVWSDYCYVQRSMDKSPYFIKILKKDLTYWKDLFHRARVPTYIGQGATVGEYIILIPVDKMASEEIDDVKVEPRVVAMAFAHNNPMYVYAYAYMKKKYGERHG